jgi:hypothetical protein
MSHGAVAVQLVRSVRAACACPTNAVELDNQNNEEKKTMPNTERQQLAVLRAFVNVQNARPDDPNAQQFIEACRIAASVAGRLDEGAIRGEMEKRKLIKIDRTPRQAAVISVGDLAATTADGMWEPYAEVP